MTKAELLRAFDELNFGADRTLNLRDSLPSAADARFRAEAWLRQRQSISQEPVLIVTGRGKGSPNGIPVVKEAVQSLLHTLKRQGVVGSWHEHSQGAIVIEPAPMNALFSAPRRHRDDKKARAQAGVAADYSALFRGLEPETVKLLRSLAERTLLGLGVSDEVESIKEEMTHKLSILVPGLPETGNREAALRLVIIRAIEELDARKYG